jgi:poly-beta-hydroxyalkanoate depolymerase
MSTHISISSIILSPAIEIKPPKTANSMMNTGLAPNIFCADSHTVFVKHALPKSEKKHAMPVNLAAIRRLGVLTVEGENDDISGIGEIPAAQDLCQTLPQWMKANYLQVNDGHYGERFRFP